VHPRTKFTIDSLQEVVYEKSVGTNIKFIFTISCDAPLLSAKMSGLS